MTRRGEVVPFEAAKAAEKVAPEPEYIRAESYVLAAVLHEPPRFTTLRAIVEPGHFAGPAHGPAWAAIGTLLADGKPINPVLIAERAGHTSAGTRAELAAYLDAIAGELGVHDAEAEELARFVKREAQRRRQARELEAIVREAAGSLEPGLAAFLDRDAPALAAALSAMGPRLATALVEEPEPGAGEPRFRVRGLSQFRQPETPKLVRGLVEHGSLILVYGGWGAGKSFFVIDLLCSIAFGDLWRGRQCDAGLGIYIAGEAAGSIQNRVRAWLLRRGKMTKGAPEPPIGVVGCAPDLLNGGSDLAELCGEIDAYRAAARLPVRAIAIDTVHSAAPGSREDAGDFGAVLANVKALARRFECAVILVHHSGKDAARGARGSNSLEAAADVIVEVVDDEVRTPVVRKVRDGEAPTLEPFVIHSVTFNQDTPDPVHVGVHELTEPPTVKDEDGKKAQARKLRASGMSCQAVGNRLGVAKGTVSKWCK